MARATSPSANPLRCGKCKEGLMGEKFFPWRPRVAFLMKCTILLFPLALYMMSKPDFYECPKCGHQKGTLWM